MKRTTSIILLIALGAAGCKRHDPGDAPTRRLTPTEYNNTVRDLMGYAPGSEDAMVSSEDEDEDEERELGVEVWPWFLPKEVEIHGFEGMDEGQVSSPYLIEQYQGAAGHFSKLMLDAPAFWACSPDGLEQDALRACASESVVRLGNRVYRRPMNANETSRLKAFFNKSVDQWGVRDGTRLTVQGLLMTPSFLYRPQPDPSEKKPQEVDGFVMANRLSYFLWDSMPDPALFAAASNGDLANEKQIEAQARRMLQDPRARQAVVHFHRQWLDLDDVYTVTADLNTYMPIYLSELYYENGRQEGDLSGEGFDEMWSGFVIGVRAGMVLEAELFVEKTIFEGEGTLRALLTDNHGYVTNMEGEFATRGGTQMIYGIPDENILGGPQYEHYFDDGNLEYNLTLKPAVFPREQRSGILTLGAVLAGKAHPVHPAPVLRGVFMLERLGCQAIGQPPDNAVGTAPADTIDAESTNRVRVEAVTSPPGCIECHKQINPPGFAMENYDSLGGWRVQDNGEPVDASGKLILNHQNVGSFNNAAELGELMAGSDVVSDCYVLNWTRYALGRDIDPLDPSLEQLQKKFRQNGGDVQELLIDITKSDLFRYH